MKLFWITFFISFSIVLHTATAIPGLRYFRSARDSVNQYRIRDAVPEGEKPSEDAIDEMGNVNPAGKVLNKMKRPIDAVQGMVRPDKLRRASPTNEELSNANNRGANDQPSFNSDDSPSMTDSNLVPEQNSTDDIGIKAPMDADLPSRQQPSYPNTEGDGPAFSYPESAMDESEDQPNQAPSTPLSRLRQFASLTSILANIARIPRNIALQVDSVMAGLQTTYPTSTNVGAYLVGTRFLLRNPTALKPFDLMDRAGLGRLDEMVSSMPSVFNPVFNTIGRYLSELIRRITTALQRIRESTRRLSERATNTLSGVNVARSNDAYSFSVPNLVDMVLKGRLASALDGYLAILQRGLVSGLAGIGNSFSPSAPIIDPVGRNQGYETRSPNAGFSSMRDYLRPARY